MSGLRVSYYFSKAFLGSRFMLVSLFWVNFLGTIYGYVWYWNQLTATAKEMSPWLLPFVPDSPTASLFFTGFLLYLLLDQKKDDGPMTGHRSAQGPVNGWRGFVEAFALITSFKYGIWAVAMIWAGAYQGNSIVWEEWMLTLSHLGMAVEALLYYRFYRYSLRSVMLVAVWIIWCDAMDYGVGVYPYLSKVLLDDLFAIALFTFGLSLAGIAVALFYWFRRTVSLAKNH